MRLWHKDLIPYLPKSQLQSQWRELNSIFKNQNRHILINYVYDESPETLLVYSWLVVNELVKRGVKVKFDNMIDYFNNRGISIFDTVSLREFKEHNNRYLLQCFYNLQEKYDRGQKDFTEDVYQNLCDYMKNKFQVMYEDLFS